MQEAKNCPFCEAIARVEHNPILGSDDPTGYAQVFCENRHSLDALHYTEEDALVEWNRRPIESALRAENARLGQERDEYRAALEEVAPIGDIAEGLAPYYIHSDTIKRIRKALAGKE